MERECGEYLNQLGEAFRNAYQKKIDLRRLYSEGKEICCRFWKDVQDGRINENGEGCRLLEEVDPKNLPRYL